MGSCPFAGAVLSCVDGLRKGDVRGPLPQRCYNYRVNTICKHVSLRCERAAPIQASVKAPGAWVPAGLPLSGRPHKRWAPAQARAALPACRTGPVLNSELRNMHTNHMIRGCRESERPPQVGTQMRQNGVMPRSRKRPLTRTDIKLLHTEHGPMGMRRELRSNHAGQIDTR